MKKMDVLAATLLVIGGLNWGLVGLLNFDLVATLFGDMTAMSRIVYALVATGLSTRPFSGKPSSGAGPWPRPDT